MLKLSTILIPFKGNFVSDTVIYLLILAAGVIAGTGLGVLLTRKQYTQPHGNLQALNELNQLKSAAALQFTETAALITELEKNQLRLREQLTSAAKQVADLDFNDLLLADTQKSSPLLAPPLDYATQRGALSEGYGLKDESQSKTADTIAPVVAGHAYDIPVDSK